MNLIFHILLSALLLLAFYQDWKFRAITWLVFPLIISVTLLIFWQLGFNWKILGSNLIFVTIVMLVLFFYVSLRERKFTNIFENHFGFGDVLFFIAISPLFGITNFILFFISGMILSGIVHLIFSKNSTKQTIPLAGYLALYVLILKGTSAITNVDFFYSNLIG